jgi:hypothetical protein
MNFGFDIDGTITAAPGVFRALVEALRDAGHEIHVITGTMDPVATVEHEAQRYAQLIALGFGPVTALHVVTAPHAENKAAYCRDHEIVLMFEDSPSYADEISRVTTCVMMHRP